jgi:hypothetical protein
MSRLVTMDETWLYRYHPEPETKQQSTEWRHSVSPHHDPKISEYKIGWKSSHLLLFFWDQDGIPLIEYLSNGQTINEEYIHLCWCN